ncbi:hypothetical protein GGR58DRAFT_454156 [Xylaria digitata]|nr:hypothetical protein GGR58DRAFT_454156 [Xylaria digitata]
MLHNVFHLLLQLCLAAWALAAPLTDETMTTSTAPTWHQGAGAGGGIIGFIILVLDIIVLIEVLKSNRPASNKLIWCLVVFLFPVVGMIIYFLFSNRKAHNTYEPLP